MKMRIDIPNSVIDRLNELGINEDKHEDVIIDFINDKLDLNYDGGLLDLFKRWTLKKDNIEPYLN